MRRVRLLPLLLTAAGLGLTLLGAALGQHVQVLQKAARVCLECIGVG